MNYDIFLVGVGGQGILTIGEILSEAALEKNLPVNFFPSKGMAQRGGFVKAQLRLGRTFVGPNIPEGKADLVVAMEQSEALKAVRFIKPGGDFVLFADLWAPMAVALGKAPYPNFESVTKAITDSGARLLSITPQSLPQYHEVIVPANLFILGAALEHTSLHTVFTAQEVETVVSERWKKAAEVNLFAFQAGVEFNPQMDRVTP